MSRSMPTMLVCVVHVVVRVPPLVARAGVIHSEAAAGDRRVTHPVVLAVHDVVPDLHVVEDLRQRQHRGAGDPRRRGKKSSARPADLERSLRLDDVADLGGVALAEVGDHAFLERVEFAAERVGLFGGKSDPCLWTSSVLLSLQGEFDVADGRGHARICTSSSSVVEIDPVMRLRTSRRGSCVACSCGDHPSGIRSLG